MDSVNFYIKDSTFIENIFIQVLHMYNYILVIFNRPYLLQRVIRYFLKARNPTSILNPVAIPQKRPSRARLFRFWLCVQYIHQVNRVNSNFSRNLIASHISSRIS